MNDRSHYLRATQAGDYPQRFAVLASINRPARHKGEAGERLGCVAWYVRVMERIDGAYRMTSVRHGWLPGERNPWPAIMRLVGAGRMLDLWIMGAEETMRANGWYQEIEEGRIIMRDDRWTGAAIVSSPPLMVICRSPRARASLRIMCLSNIGVHGIADLSRSVRSDELDASVLDDITYDPFAKAMVLSSYVCEYLATWFRVVVNERLGAVKPTIAGQAWGAFRHRFMRHPLLCHDSIHANNLEYAGTYSGRAECFRLGVVDGPLFHYDVRSCYPTLLRGAQVPCRMKYVGPGNADTITTAMATGFACIADITLRTTIPIFPCKRRGLVVWPIGQFRTVLCGPELTLAMALRPTPIVHRIALYETDCIFDKWIEWALNYRLKCRINGDVIGENVAKLLTNSLWGRFAKRDLVWRNIADDYTYRKWHEWWEREPGCEHYSHFRAFGGLCQEQVDEGYNRESIPIVTAFINSLGRAYLWQLMVAAGLENVVYVATDSLIVTATGNIRLQHHFGGGHLMCGKLKLHGWYQSMEVRGINHYTTQGGHVDSGIPLQSERGEDGSAAWSQVEPLRGPLARGKCPSNAIVHQTRKVISTYSHGRVDASGRVHPHQMKVEW